MISRVALSLLTLFAVERAAGDSVPRFVSLQANKVINEVRGGEVFYFETCNFYHLDGSSVAEELAAKAFVGCAPLGAPHPLLARAAVERELNLALSDRRRDLGDPSAARWALDGFVQGALFGGIIRVGARHLFVRAAYPGDRVLRDFIRWGGFFGVANGWAQARRAIGAQGANQAVLGVIDGEMPAGTYILDQRTNDRRAQGRAFDAIAGVIERTTKNFRF